MSNRHYRLDGFVAAMALGIATALMPTAQAQSGDAEVVTTPSAPSELGGWIEHNSQMSDSGWIEHNTQMASPHGSGGLECDHQGNCRQTSELDRERMTMFAGISLDPPEQQPLCDTDPYSCFYLVNKDQTLPGALRNTLHAFLE